MLSPTYDDRQWILKKDNLSTIRECNKLIRDEFGVRLSLVQDDILKQIITYSNLSGDRQLKKLSTLITSNFPQLKNDDEKESDRIKSQYYRGRRVN